MKQEFSCKGIEALLEQEGLDALTREPAAHEHVQHCLQCGLLCEQYRALAEFEGAEPGPSAELAERTLAAVKAQVVQPAPHRLRGLLKGLSAQLARETQAVRRSRIYQNARTPLLALALLGLAATLLASLLGGLGAALTQVLVPLLLVACCLLSLGSLVLREPRRAAGFAVICLVLVLTSKRGEYAEYRDARISDSFAPVLSAKPEVFDESASRDFGKSVGGVGSSTVTSGASAPQGQAMPMKAPQEAQRRISKADSSALRENEGKDRYRGQSLKALKDRWNPQDAFQLEEQVGNKLGTDADSKRQAPQQRLGGRLDQPGAYQLDANLPAQDYKQKAAQLSVKKELKTRVEVGDKEGATREKDSRDVFAAFGLQSMVQVSPLAEGSSSTLNSLSSNTRSQVERLTTENLQFQDPKGYWANNYIPGDPAYQLLANRLARSSRHDLPAINGQLPLLEQLSERVPQPFDAPDFSSLAIYLTSDQTQIQGKTRALLQVGIKASERKRGSRPTMNIAVVLDLPASALDAQMLETISSLLRSLEKERQVGDRFSLVLAGRAGGALIQPGDFRYGTVRVAIERLRSAEAGAETLSSTQALAKAIRFARQGDDANAPLGSSVVLFASLRDISPNLSALRLLAHDSAVSGVPVSVVTLGSSVPQEPLDELVLAGQGSRRFVTSPEEAEQAIQRELESLTKVVARALRLRIRLNPKVKLIRVLGSQRLDERRAQEQRQAEQSIDQRVARSIGITADRGEDEDGIQVIIPAFYAGDAHAILLDVVVNEPGELADVQLRYKDLLNLKNSVARAMLNVPAFDQRPVGALERNVTRNYLAYQLYDGLQQTATAVERSDYSQARTLVEELHQNLANYQPLFAQDRSLGQDLQMLHEFSAVLAQARGQEQQEFISDALNYAAQRKILQQAIE
jgi:hypothetical protein